MDLDAGLEIYLVSGYRIQTVLFNEALELMNTVMEDDGELGIWLEVTHWIHLILF
jgi:hypothetical protein